MPTPVCAADCNRDGIVTVGEILTMVNIALGNAPTIDCLPGDANDDGHITVDEILMAVNNALNGCHAGGAALCYAPRPAAVEHVSGGDL